MCSSAFAICSSYMYRLKLGVRLTHSIHKSYYVTQVFFHGYSPLPLIHWQLAIHVVKCLTVFYLSIIRCTYGLMFFFLRLRSFCIGLSPPSYLFALKTSNLDGSSFTGQLLLLSSMSAVSR